MGLRYAMGLAALAALIWPSGFAQDTRVARAGGKNPVDEILDAAWKRMKIKPAAPAGDSEFLRRVTLDIVGTIPEPADVEKFAANGDPRKREKKVDELLSSAQFAEYWADRLTSALNGYRDRQYPTIDALRSWLAEKLKAGTSYNRIVEELITAKGSNKEENATAFVVQHISRDRTKQVLTVQVSKVFLGIQLQCAQCHDHPFEKWKKEDFQSMVAFFGGTNLRVIERMENNRDSEVEVTDAPARRGGGRAGPGGRKPRFIDGTEVNPDGARQALARMITAPENLQFARATVNRMWAEFTGRGFVEPIDDFSSKNEPSMPELLDALAAGFVENNFDLKWVMRTIATSKAYQLTSARKPKQFADEDAARDAYAFQIVRPMAPEQTLNSILTAQGLLGVFEGARGRARDGGDGGRMAPGMDDRRERLRRGFLLQLVLTSGTENQVSPSEYNASMQQIMRQLDVNAPIYAGIRARGVGRLARILRETRQPERVVGQLYLATLSRPPRSEELQACLQYFQDRGRNDAAFEDIFFVLLQTNEFFFNH
jgi:hypothetical protein